MAKLTPMLRQYRQIKEEFAEEFLFFRLGDFYEMFFDDAVRAAELLQIALTARSGGEGLKVPMCGVPVHSASGYIRKIVQSGHKVAICEQVEDPQSAKGIVRREVVRVVTPGTILEEGALIDGEHNHLACLSAKENRLGIAYCDVSTGSFWATEVPALTGWSDVMDELARIRPSELISTQKSLPPHALRELSDAGYCHTQLERSRAGAYRTRVEAISDAQQSLWDHLGAHHAAAVLLRYLEDTQKRTANSITALHVYELTDHMRMDMGTRRNLEITRGLRDGDRRICLAGVLDRTKTAMGSRRLKEMLEQPLVDRDTILWRQDMVQALVEDVFTRRTLGKLLKPVYDLERILTRVVYERVNARDLLALRISLDQAARLKDALHEAGGRLGSFAKDVDALPGLCETLRASLADDPPVSIQDGGLFAEGHHEEVDELRRLARTTQDVLDELERRERTQTGIKSLKVGYNRVFGYYIEVTKTHGDKVPERYVRKQTLSNSERYVTQELKELEDRILHARERLHALEYELFCALRQDVAQSLVQLQHLAERLALLDALVSFAQIAVEHDYVRPVLCDEPSLRIEQGRHPVVERLLQDEPYVPNDCTVETGAQGMAIITGPNMAGKSTYIRMAAVLCVLAQAGSFVPCARMEWGVVDRVFARVGASDDLARGDSTFMVEMKEVANILEHATDHSLIILDEVGRGTSTIDGLAIAWAISEYIVGKVRARTLFATHFHELVALEKIHEGIVNYSMAVEEREHDVVFLRRVVRGGTDRSYGIHVARMAGLPEAVLVRADARLRELSREEYEPVRQDGVQVAWDDVDPALTLLAQIEPDELNPKQALDVLYELKERSHYEKG